MNLENKKQIATILLAIGLGLVASLLTGQYIHSRIEEEKKASEAKIAQSNEKIRQDMEKRYADLTRKVAAQDQAIQQIRLMPAASGGPGPAVETRIASLSQRTPPGKRAVTINMDALSAVGGLISPGDFVDIIAELDIPDQFDATQKPEKVTTILFQNIQVLAVETNLKPIVSEESFKQLQQARSLHVTLALEPQEAGLLAFAQDNGKLQFSLRSPSESETTKMQVASWQSLADFVLEKQDTQLIVPKPKASIEKVDDKNKKEEVKPFIEIFKGGKEL